MTRYGGVPPRELVGLDDVAAGGIADGEGLVWDEASGLFVPGSVGGGGAGGDPVIARFEWSYRGDSGFSGSGFAFKGNQFTPHVDLDLYALVFWGTRVSAGQYQSVAFEWSGGTIDALTLSPVVTLPTITNAVGAVELPFTTPVTLVAGTTYGLAVGRVDAGNTHALPVPFNGSTTPTNAVPMPGDSHGAYVRVADATPTVGTAVDSSSTNSVGIGHVWALA